MADVARPAARGLLRRATATRPVSRRAAGGALMLSAPALVLLLLFVILPTLAVFGLSLTDYQLGDDGLAFVGLDNYRDLLGDAGFRGSLRNTVVYAALVTPASVLIGLGLALLIEAETRGKAFFRTVFFLPVVSLIVAMATVWQYLLHPTIGPVDQLLHLSGLPGPNWLGGSDTVLISLALIGVWQSVGYNMVLFLAGLTAIPRDLYAAAAVDGAGTGWQRFRLVTWPMLGPTTLFVVTIGIINAVKVFETVQTLTEGGPNRASEVLLFTIYREGFVYLRVGAASTMTVAFLVLLVGLMLVQVRIQDRRTHYA